MTVDRRGFAKSLTGILGAVAAGSSNSAASQAPQAGAQARAARLPPTKITRIRAFYPPNYDRNGPQAFPQSNMVVLVDTEAGITGVGQGGSPDTVRNVARSVIGKNAFDTEMIWQAAFMDGFYSPGKERLHALGAIDLALWDIKGKALERAALSAVRWQGARAHRAVRHVGAAAGRRAAGRSRGDGAEGARGGDDGGRLSRVSRRRRHPAEHRACGAGQGAARRCPGAGGGRGGDRSIRERASRRSSRRSSRSARASGRTATG